MFGEIHGLLLSSFPPCFFSSLFLPIFERRTRMALGHLGVDFAYATVGRLVGSGEAGGGGGSRRFSSSRAHRPLTPIVLGADVVTP